MPLSHGQLRPSAALASNHTLTTIYQHFIKKEKQKSKTVFCHGVYPYFYIPYNGSKDVDAYIHDLVHAVNEALIIYLGKIDDYVPGIKGVAFYGFHPGYSYFLNIYLYDPTLISKSELLMEKTCPPEISSINGNSLMYLAFKISIHHKWPICP